MDADDLRIKSILPNLGVEGVAGAATETPCLSVITGEGVTGVGGAVGAVGLTGATDA